MEMRNAQRRLRYASGETMRVQAVRRIAMTVDHATIPHATVPDGRAYFPWLDALRGFAAFSVIVYHLIVLANLPVPATMPWQWFRFGFLGVDLFFAISGAVILLALEQSRHRAPTRYRTEFFRHRLARILPLYLITCVVFMLLVKPDILQRPDLAHLLIAQLLFVQNLSASTHGVINGPSWSLGLEMQFYVVMTIGGVLLLKSRGWILPAMLFAIALGWRALVWWQDAGSHIGTPDPAQFIHATELPGVIDAFAAGMLVALWQRRRRVRGDAQNLRLALVLGVLALLCWFGALDWFIARAGDYWTNPASAIGLRSMTALAGGLTVATAFAAPPLRFGRALMMLCGDLSYGLYLWHMPVLLWLQSRMPTDAPWRFALAVFALTIALSALTWFAIERPILRWARRPRVAIANPH
jgi:peptidoglycan/LPS O-acetylase OafA/YrhL